MNSPDPLVDDLVTVLMRHGYTWRSGDSLIRRIDMILSGLHSTVSILRERATLPDNLDDQAWASERTIRAGAAPFIAAELRDWAEDIEEGCWSLAALPRVLRERANELNSPGAGTEP